MSVDTFEQSKRKLLSDIEGGIDYSPKGSIDVRIRELVEFINTLDCFATTSSCSGRISIFRNTSPGAKGVDWLLVKHSTVCREEVLLACSASPLHPVGGEGVLTVLKCEGFILHVLCRDLPSACSLHGKL